LFKQYRTTCGALLSALKSGIERRPMRLNEERIGGRTKPQSTLAQAMCADATTEAVGEKVIRFVVSVSLEPEKFRHSEL
jgi:hypothetical protein